MVSASLSYVNVLRSLISDIIIFLVNIIQPLKDISKMVYAVYVCSACVIQTCYNKISTQITLAMSKLLLNIVFYMWVVNPDLISLFLPLLILWYVGILVSLGQCQYMYAYG